MRTTDERGRTTGDENGGRRSASVRRILALVHTSEHARQEFAMTIAQGEIAGPASTKRDERRAAAVACGAHALHDGYTDLIYVLLPVWQAEFGLGYAELGLLRGLFAGTMASFQIPSALLAERLGTTAVLALGTALTGVGYLLAGASAGFAMLMVALIVGGLGASTQHPLASSLVARAFAGPRSMKALGTYNFSGDIGKMTVPAAAALMLSVIPWRPSVSWLGIIGLVAGAAIYALTPRRHSPQPGDTAPVSATDGARIAAPLAHSGFPWLLSI